MNFIHLTALALLTASSLLALPEPIACWKADGQAQPEAGAHARTTRAIDIAYRQGVAGKAFSFDGKTSVIEAAFEWKSASPTTTWSVWIRPTESPRQLEILTNGPFANALYIRNGKIAIYNAGRNLEFGKVKWGAWQHVAVVFAPDHVTVYDRGGPSRQAFPLRGAFSQQRLLIGGSELSGLSAYSGLIDHVAIYDRELSPAEIAEIAIRPKESSREEASKPGAKTPEASPAKPPQQWINTKGKAITAEFVRLDGDAVVVKSGGKEHRILFANLAEASIRQAKASAEADPVDASPAPPSQPDTGAAPIPPDKTKQAIPRANPPDSLALDLSVPKPPTPKHWHWPHQGGGSYALGMPSQSKIQSLWGALQITTAQMDRLMALWQETVINACNEDEKQFHPAVAKFALEREAILTPAQKDTRQRIVNYYADLTTRLKAQGLAGEELSLKAAEQARKDLPTLLTPQETDCWHTVEDARQRASAEKPAK